MTHELDDVTPLTWSAPSYRELEEIADLLTAIYYFDEPTQRFTLDDLEDFYRRNPNPTDHIVVGREADSVVAYGWNAVYVEDVSPRRIRLGGGVHPAFRHQSIGRKLLAWQQERARDWYLDTHTAESGPLRMLAYVDEKLGNQRDLYRRAGMTKRRWYLDMYCRLGAMTPEEPPEVPGIQVIAYRPDLSEAIRQAHNDAFAAHPEAQPIRPASWAESMMRSSARPEWSWVAVNDDGEVVGYALNSAYAPHPYSEEYLEGWTDRIGVRPAWRRRGIARALLIRSLQSFRDAGLERGGLGVDSHKGTDSLGMYHSIGYHETDTIIRYGLDETYDQIVARRNQKGSA